MQGNPLNILSVAQSNATVAGIISRWKQGSLSWDGAMMLAVCVLAEQNEKLLEKATNAEVLKIPPPIRVGGNEFAYTGPCPFVVKKLENKSCDAMNVGFGNVPTIKSHRKLKSGMLNVVFLESH
jgi:hypothetical protein